MRVLHVYSGNLYGGVESVISTLGSQRYQIPEFQQEFALCFQSKLWNELSSEGAILHSLDDTRFRYPWTIARARRRLRRLIQSHAYDAVICHSSWALGIFGSVVKSSGQKLVFWVHDFLTGQGWIERLASKIEPDLVICNSRYTRESVASQYPGVHSEVIYCPVKPGVPIERATARAKMRKTLGVSENTVLIMQVSRMEPWKGHAVLIQALGLLNNNSTLSLASPWKAVFVGGAQRASEESYLKELKHLTEKLSLKDKISFLGFRSDIPDLLSAADIFVQANLSPEPFGVSYIEAMYAELPVVGVSGGGADETISPETGVLLRRPDSHLLAEALRDLIKTREGRQALGGRGPHRARELCDPVQQIEKIKGALVRRVEAPDTIERAKLSLGMSSEVLYQRVAETLESRVGSVRVRRILDVGCGSGAFKRFIAGRFEHYVGVDAIRHEDLPQDIEFVQVNLDQGRIPLESGTFDAVVSVETIEHLENPRALVREMSRLCRSGGFVILTTPNQVSFLSMMTLLMKNEFNAFRVSSYPAHITALLGVDLLRIAKECALEQARLDYSLQGRIPLSGAHFPFWLSRLFPRQFSDNVILSAFRSSGK